MQESEKPARRLRVFRLAPLFVLCAGLALFVDIAVARFSMLHDAPGDIQKALMLSEIFGHGFGIGIVCVTIAVLDRASRRRLPRLLGCAFLPGLVTHFLKIAIGRMRPYNYATEKQVLLPDDVRETFVGWFASLTPDKIHAISPQSVQSFPSGHTATAVGCAIGLAWLYPRGRWLFASLALLVAIQRIESGSHFVSDTFGAAAVACLVAGLCVSERGIGRLFSRLENRDAK